LIWAVGLAKTVGNRAILVKVGEMAAEETPAGRLQIQGFNGERAGMREHSTSLTGARLV